MTVETLPIRDVAYLHTEWLRKNRNLALGTRRTYQSIYHTFATHLEPQVGREPLTSDLTYDTLEDYFSEYVAANSPKAWSMKRGFMIDAVKWMMRKGYLEYGPNFAEDIPLRKADAARPRDHRLSDNEFLSLLKIAKASHARDYFLCLFLRFTGRRISEVVGSISADAGIRWGDVRWDEDVIIWDNIKARRHGRKMPLTPRLRAILEAWKAAYAAAFGMDDLPNDWYVFPALTATGTARKGRPRKRVLSPKSRMTNPNRVIRPLMESAGLYVAGDGWHVLRHSFANQRKQKASNDGRADAWEMTKLSLDHADESTTRRYVNEQEDQQRYFAWAMGAEEMTWDAMSDIPELAQLAADALTPDTQKTPASEDTDALIDGELSNVVSFVSFAGRRRALG